MNYSFISIVYLNALPRSSRHRAFSSEQRSRYACLFIKSTSANPDRLGTCFLCLPTPAENKDILIHCRTKHFLTRVFEDHISKIKQTFQKLQISQFKPYPFFSSVLLSFLLSSLFYSSFHFSLSAPLFFWLLCSRWEKNEKDDFFVGGGEIW